MNSEIARIRKVYQLRKEKGISWSVFRPEIHFMDFELKRKYLEAFKLYGVNEKNVSTKRLLDAGCGDARLLRWFQDLGFKDLFGIDILDWQIFHAQKENPAVKLFYGSISELPFKNNYFDIVIVSQVFASILDYAVLKESAQEVLRVLIPGGIIVFDDLRKFDRKTPKLDGQEYLKPLRESDLIRLFPGSEIKFFRCLVNPFFTGTITSILNRGIVKSILRKIPRVNKIFTGDPVVMIKFPYVLGEFLKYISFFNIHIFAIIKKSK